MKNKNLQKPSSIQESIEKRSLKKVSVAHTRTVIISALCAMLFIPGLVMICESTVTDDSLKKGFLIAIGAVFMTATTFITPITAIHAGEITKRYNLVQAVVSCKLYTIGELSMKLQMDCHDVSDLLNICICKGYLSEYIRQNDTLVLNEHIANVATSHDYECDHCGAVVTLQQGENLICPYCGCALPKNTPNKKQ